MSAVSTGLPALRSICAWLALLAGIVSVLPQADALAASFMLMAVLFSWQQLRAIPRVLLLLAMAAGLAAALLAPEALAQAVASTARLGALVIAVLLLSGTLGASRDVQVLSGNLLAGRPLARYLGVAFATGVLAVPLNFGAVAVMSAVVSRLKQSHGDHALVRNTARAVLRGFAVASLSSPLSISVVLTLTFLPGLRLLELIAVSGSFAVLFLLLGAAFREREDAAADPIAPESIDPASPALPQRLWPAWLRFAGTIAAICIGAYLASHAGGMVYARAVAVSCVAAVGLSLLMRTVRTRKPAALPSLAQIGNELAVLGGSAFLGVLAGHAGASLLGTDVAPPPWSFPVLAFGVPWVLFAGGMAGLNPIVTGTLVGALLGPIWPASAVLGLGVGTVCGWGLTVAGTPWSANSLLLSRLTGYDARTAAWHWNLPLSLLALALAGLLAGTLTWTQTAT